MVQEEAKGSGAEFCIRCKGRSQGKRQEIYDKLAEAMLAAPVVIPIVDHAIGTGTASVPDLPKGNFTLYIDTVNINIKGGM